MAKVTGWEVPPRTDPFTGETTGGYSTRDPSAAFKPGAKPVYGGGGGSSYREDRQEAERWRARQVEIARQAEITRQQQQQAQAQAKLQTQLKQQQLVQQYTAGQRRTITTSPPTISDKVHPPGTIYTVQTDTFKVPGKDKYIPITKTYTIGKDWASREPTEEEREALRIHQDSLAWEELIKEGKPSRIKFEASELYGKYKDLASEELYSREQIQSVLGTSKVGKYAGGQVYEFIGTKGGAMRTGVTLGVTAGIGFLIGAGTRGAIAGATALFGARAGAVTGTALKLGTYGAGAYFGGKYAYTTLQQIHEAPTAWEKGRITGRAGADVVAGLYGFRAGAKGWDITYGKLRTRGMPDITKLATDPKVESGQRRFVEISKLEFQKLKPLEKSKLDIELFKRNIELQKALNVKPGGVHATDLPGDYSELSRALHIAPEASTQFLGLSKIKKYKLFPSFKDISSPKKPGLIWVETTGGIKAVVGTEVTRGTYVWKGKLFSGLSAYAPGTKPEIQAVFDPLVTKGFESVQYTPGYIITNGVRVPFVGAYKPISSETIPSKVLTPKSPEFVSYSSYKSPPIVDVTAGIVSIYKPSTTSIVSTTTAPSYVSVTPSYSSVASSTPSYSSLVSSSKPISSSKAISKSKSYSSAISSIVPSSSLKPSKSSKTSMSKLYSSIVSSSIKKSYKSPYGYSYKKPPVTKLPFLKPIKLPKQSFGRFEVFGRRFGKWKVVSLARTPRQAIIKGTRFARKGLGRSFYVPGIKQPKKLRGFRTKKEKGIGQIYVQKTGKGIFSTLGTAGEKKEIQFYKGLKLSMGGKKK